MGSAHLFYVTAFALFSVSCLRAAPEAQEAVWEADCGPIPSGRACVTLKFSLEPSIREGAEAPMKGDLHWALYAGGDVGLFGPGDNDSLYEGRIDGVDLAMSDQSVEVHVGNAASGAYQVLAFLDRDANGKSNSGDPVTFPSDAFMVRRDLRTRVDVVLDYVR